MCYHVKHGSSATNGICVETEGKPQNWEALRRGCLPPCATHIWSTEFGRSRSNGTSVIKAIRLKKIPRVPPFNVTKGQRN